MLGRLVHSFQTSEQHKQHIDNILQLPVSTLVKHRLPWLMLGLVGGLMAAGVVEVFEGTLKNNLVLAAFIPLIMYMSGAVSAQTGVFAVRDMAVHYKINLRKYAIKQFLTITVVGLILSVVLFGAVGIYYTSMRIAFVLAVSLLVAIISSVFTGLAIPLVLRNFKLDPANASGPIATIIQDLMSVSIYFTVASWLL